MLVIIPFILLGDIILFISLKFSVVEMIILLVSSIVLPIVAEVIGIIVNINHPKMDAENDTEVVKQSSSSMISVFAGFGMLGLTVLGMLALVNLGLKSYLILLFCSFSVGSNIGHFYKSCRIIRILPDRMSVV